ncbi:hypothetical protein SLA2020_407150 [Shorea laevis]
MANRRENDDVSEDDDDDDCDEEMGDSDEEESVGNSSASGLKRVYTAEEREAEAAAIGYKVVGPLERSDRVFKPYEAVFAVVQIGSHQFKVSNGDCIFTERLKFCEVNEKLILNKVLLIGSSTQTVVGRPIVPEAAVHAVVEEHALDAKELTKLRITDIQGIEKPEKIVTEKPTKAAEKAAEKKPEKVLVTA